MLNLTEKQREAVFTRDCDLLVSAAAGSGKTAVLSERILQEITDKNNPADVTEFLIVTFTNAAAAEMKDRIGKKILEASSDESLEPELKKHLKRQLSLMSKASINTIHSFCLDVVKNNFHFLDIDPNVRVADKNEIEILKMQVADDMTEQMFAEEGGLFSEAIKWLGGGQDEAFISRILEIYRFINGFSNPIGWLNEKIEEYNPDNFVESSKEWIERARKIAVEDTDLLLNSAKKLHRNLVRDNIDSYQETVEQDIAALEKYLAILNEGKDFLKYVISFQKLKPKPKDAEEELCKKYQKQRDEIKKKAIEIVSNLNFNKEELLFQTRKMYPLLKCVQKSILTFDKLFKEKKKKLSIIDFSDFEHLALEVLADESNGVAKMLSEKYREIMVDEYQDCNQTQELIFSYISKKIDGTSSNMFMVGDIKQSIYRFRLADPDIFSDKNRSYKGEGLQRKIVLNKNFRSSATILDGINSVFEKTMTQDFGGTDYTDDEKLFFRDDEPDKNSESKCEFAVIDKSISDDGEADYIAEKIIEYVKGGYKFSDIVVLSRSSANLTDVEVALKQREIPYFTDGGNGYFESVEITLLSSMLKVIDNPMQDIELAALLRSPMFEFDDNLLAKIRLTKKGPYYGALIKYAAEKNDGVLKCRDFLNTLSKWRDKVLFTPVDEFIEYVIAESGLDIFVMSLPGGEQRMANLKLFVLQARQLQNSGFSGLFSFVSYMERMSAGGESSEAKLLSENSNVVRLMTIHKSKGLEFPIVFLCSCDKAFYKRDTYGDLIFHKNAGIGIKMLDFDRKIKYPMITHSNVKYHMLKDNMAEEMRVLYVALTRAKEKLICTATLKVDISEFTRTYPKEFSSFDARSAKCYFDWIKLGFDENWKVDIISPDDISVTVFEADKIEFDNVEVSNVKEVYEALEYKYPFDLATNLPTKISVSEIKRRNEISSPEETKLYIPEISKTPSFMSEDKISSADKGIINHLVFRHINLLNPDAEKCRNELIEKELLSPDESKFVDTDAIDSFFKCEMGERIKNSDSVQRELAFSIDVPADELFKGQKASGETIMLQGIIDLVFEEKGSQILIDYKTDRFLDIEKTEMYKKQLDLYQKALEKISDKKVSERYLYMLSTKEFIKM